MVEDQHAAHRKLLARLIREQRIRKGWGIEDGSRAAGMSRITWRNAEAGVPVRDAKLGQIESALGWPSGTVLAVLSGDLTEAPEAHPADSAVPVGTGVDPLDLSVLQPEDQDYIRRMYEMLRQQRGE